MKSIQIVGLASALLGGIAASQAATLDFTTAPSSAGSISGSAIYINQTVAYNGFTFEFSDGAGPLTDVKTAGLGDAAIGTTGWMWLTSADSAAIFNPAAIGFTGAGNGFVTHAAKTPAASFDSFAITSASPFFFGSADFSGFAGDTVTVKLYNGTTLEGTVTSGTFLSTGQVLNVTAGIYAATPITSLVISGFQQYYAMDNLTYTAAPVPEASTYAMMLAGLLGVGWVTARRRSR